MASKWKRLPPTGGQVGQIQAVQAKKHLTIFVRDPRAPGAGTPRVKAGFTECAQATLGISNRQERNDKLKGCMESKGLKTGIYRKKSRARPGSRLFGKVYVYSPTGGVSVE